MHMTTADVTQAEQVRSAGSAMSVTTPVSLQISLAPGDLAHAKYTVPHQLRQWADQVDETLLVLDAGRPGVRRSREWKENLTSLRRLIDACCAEYRNVRALDVDYSADVARELARAYFGGASVPATDWNGTAFYAYFFGLWAARHRYVFHMDSDMMYGGGSRTWVREAVALLASRPDVLICSPLPGPPTDDGRLTSQALEPEPLTSLAYRAHSLSTRLFVIDRRRFHSRIGQVTLLRPPHRRWVLQALVEGRPPYEVPELIFSHAMSQHGLLRIDFLGSAPGMWSVHPPYRSALFYERLPALIEAIEAGDVPGAQRGDHDINYSMIDWTSARKSLRQKLLKHQRLIVNNLASKLAR